MKSGLILTILSLLIIATGLPGSLSAQNRPSFQAGAVETPVTIDGRLDEKAWQEAEAVSGFRQFEPDEGAAASQETEVRMLYGAGSLYVAAVLFDTNPAGIEQVLARRDEYNRADWFLVSVDSYFNRRSAYTFGVNAAGVQLDALQTAAGGGPGGGEDGGPLPPGMDVSWDAVWHVDVRVTDRGWMVEMRIPYSMLRFPGEPSQTWGVHFTRRIPRLGEVSEWPLIPRTRRINLVAQYGLLTNIENIQPQPNLQIRPYTVSRLRTEESVDTPGEAVASYNMDVGGDIKIGLGPNITLDATINPDFGQVESDPAVLNLTAFETFFDERRPFFIEGIHIYEFAVGPGELLYTRRIGAQNPIIGAAKLSGRTAKGLSFGVLGATTGENFNPSHSYGVARMIRQIGDYSTAGGILTGFDGPAPDGNGRLQSMTGGADFDFRFSGNRYGIEGFAAFTHRNPAAPEGETETGFAGKVWFRKRQGILNGFTGVDVYSDRFNPNDLGQFRENNFFAVLTQVEYQINDGRPFGPVRRAGVTIFGIEQFSYKKGLNLGQSLEIGSDWMLRSFQQIQFGINIENMFGGYDLYETRGLGPWAQPSGIGFRGEFDTDERRSWEAGPEGGLTLYNDGGRSYNLMLRTGWNIGTRLSLEGNLGVEWEDGVTAWTSNETFLRTGPDWMIGEESVPPDELDAGDFVAFEDQGLLDDILSEMEPYAAGRYYVPVFGARDTRSLDFTLRGSVTFTPYLSLQMYSQLFLAKGRYDDFRILQNRDDLAPFDPYPKRDEFTLNSLQSNIVLRWQYRPGSTIYLVWTHGRNLRESLNPLAPPMEVSPYEKSFGDRAGDVFGIFPQNAFLLKIDYTFLY